MKLISNRAVLFFGEFAWVVQGIDRDICAQGPTVAGAIESFERTVAGELAINNYEQVGQPPEYLTNGRRWRILDTRPSPEFDLPTGPITLDTKYYLADVRPEITAPATPPSTQPPSPESLPQSPATE